MYAKIFIKKCLALFNIYLNPGSTGTLVEPGGGDEGSTSSSAGHQLSLVYG